MTACNATANTVCAPLRVCNGSEFESVAPTAVTDRVCSAVTVCGPLEDEALAATNTTDRRCVPFRAVVTPTFSVTAPAFLLGGPTTGPGALGSSAVAGLVVQGTPGSSGTARVQLGTAFNTAPFQMATRPAVEVTAQVLGRPEVYHDGATIYSLLQVRDEALSVQTQPANVALRATGSAKLLSLANTTPSTTCWSAWAEPCGNPSGRVSPRTGRLTWTASRANPAVST